MGRQILGINRYMIMEPKIKDIAVLISSLNINHLEAIMMGNNLYKPCSIIVRRPTIMNTSMYFLIDQFISFQ